mmetsp:Transcript_14208/g.30845  ORF Transcript_14208/g.30845 Transcript_14208/m.30845 type:complete len:324 (-) Transcript_14208:949-1920(-)
MCTSPCASIYICLTSPRQGDLIEERAIGRVEQSPGERGLVRLEHARSVARCVEARPPHPRLIRLWHLRHLVAAGTADHDGKERLVTAAVVAMRLARVRVVVASKVGVHAVSAEEGPMRALELVVRPVAARNDPRRSATSGTGLGGAREVILEPREVLALSPEAPRGELLQVRIAGGLLSSTLPVRLRVEGHHVQGPQIERVPHVGGGAVRFGKGHRPSAVEGREVAQRSDPCVGVEHASGRVALRLVVSGRDNVRHARSDRLEPSHVTVVVGLVREAVEAVGPRVVGVADVPQVPHAVHLATIDLPAQHLIREARTPVLREAL